MADNIGELPNQMKGEPSETGYFDHLRDGLVLQCVDNHGG
jgi:hypothetical protein